MQEIYHAEKNLSAQGTSPIACPRFSNPDVHRGWSQGIEKPPLERPLQIDRLKEQPRETDQLEQLKTAAGSRVRREFRLTRSTDFKRVRRFGKSFAHPLIVLVALPSESSETRIAVSAGRSVGGAVQRNRAKRLLREAIRPLLPGIPPGWNMVIISRHGLAEASFHETQTALRMLLRRARLIKNGAAAC